MAKNFGKAGSASTFGAVAKVEQEKAQVIVLQNISNENLIDNPKNGEDIRMTSDLEESMRQNGFTDPIEVTDFNMENGKYMILSGHRRRAAGIKVGITIFPCVVRHFKTEEEVQNYTLMANSQRDSAKDPCLFCTRYKMHEEYLESIGFKGSKREEIAKRLGISVQQADRYNTMNKIILPVWDMVRAEIVGMSSVMPMAKHNEAEQTEIYNIMQEALKKDVSLTRDTVKVIVDGYRDGKKTWAEIADLPRDSGLPLNGFMNTEPGETKESSNGNRNDEIRREHDPIAEAYDEIDANRAEWERKQAEEKQGNAEDEETVDEVDENDKGKEKTELTREEKQVKLGEEIEKQLNKLDTNLNNIWSCEDKDKAKNMLSNMKSVAQVLIDEMYRVSEEWNMSDEFESALKSIGNTINQY